MASRRKRRQPATAQTPAGRDNRLLSLCRQRITWEMAGPAILFLFAAYLSILYFGHQMVPNSDFPAFVRTGRDILHFHLPHSFKRLPGLGILQVILSTVTPGPYPVLTAGLLLNALMYPFCGLLLYGIARRFLGKGAFWITLLALVNPWVLRWMRHPIVELSLIFFILLTFWLLFEKGRWAYPAAFAASMIRYEGAVLIVIVFVWDVLQHRSWRQWLIAVGLGFITALPVSLWVFGQIWTHKPGDTSYLVSYQSAAKGAPMVFGKFSGYVWRESIGSYYKIPDELLENDQDQEASDLNPLPTGVCWAKIAMWTSRGFLIAGLVTAVGWGIYKKRWDVVSLFAFAGIYFLLHASRTGTRPRYVVPIVWIVLLVCLYGIRSIWEIIQGERRIPKKVIAGLQVALVIVSILLAVSVIDRITELERYSPSSKSIPLVALLAAVLFAIIQLIRTRGRQFMWNLTAVGLTAFALAGNQVDLLQRVGNGAMDKEFKELAKWYLKNAAPGEKIVTTMPHILTLFAPEKEKNFFHTQWITGDTPQEFIQDCYRRHITYVAWDSRLGIVPQNPYYKMYKLDRIAFLGPRFGPDNRLTMPPKKNGPFELIETIQNDFYPMRFIFIYRLAPRPKAAADSP